MAEGRGTQSGHRARKRFGQNFLHDPTVISRITQAIAPRPGQHIVEIGPGLGAMTQPLIDSGCRLTVIEIDRDLAARLRQAHAETDQFALIEHDVLRVDIEPLTTDGPIRVVGNLPYNISTPVLFKLLAVPDVTDMHFMLQKEVVDRITAQPGESAYGRLSVAVAAAAAAVKLLDVKPGAFNPPPKVQSAVVRITPRPPAFEITDPDRFDTVVRAAFGQRRKTLANALRGIVDKTQIQSAGVDPSARAEVITPAQFAALAALAAPAAEPASN